MKKISLKFSGGSWTWLFIAAVVIGVLIMVSFRIFHPPMEIMDAFMAVGAVVWALLAVCGVLGRHITVEDLPAKDVTNPMPRLSHREWKEENDKEHGFLRR